MPGLMINFRYSAKYNTWFQWGMTMIYFDVKQNKQKNKYEEAIS